MSRRSTSGARRGVGADRWRRDGSLRSCFARHLCLTSRWLGAPSGGPPAAPPCVAPGRRLLVAACPNTSRPHTDRTFLRDMLTRGSTGWPAISSVPPRRRATSRVESSTSRLAARRFQRGGRRRDSTASSCGWRFRARRPGAVSSDGFAGLRRLLGSPNHRRATPTRRASGVVRAAPGGGGAADLRVTPASRRFRGAARRSGLSSAGRRARLSMSLARARASTAAEARCGEYSRPVRPGMSGEQFAFVGSRRALRRSAFAPNNALLHRSSRSAPRRLSPARAGRASASNRVVTATACPSRRWGRRGGVLGREQTSRGSGRGRCRRRPRVPWSAGILRIV